MWVDNVMTSMYSKFGVKRLNGLFHDEFITSFKDTPENRVAMEDMTVAAIDKVNDDYLLRREMGCDCQFGSTYADIH